VKVVLVAGPRHKTYLKFITEHTVLNKKVMLNVGILAEYLQNYNVSFDCILITDGGLLSDKSESVIRIKSLLEERGYEDTSIKLITHDFYIKNELRSIVNIDTLLTSSLRINEPDIIGALQNIQKAAHKQPAIEQHEVITETQKPPEEKKAKHKPFGIGKKPKIQETIDESVLSNISMVQNKVVAFTGRGGVGVTSSVVNLAYLAAKKGLSVIIVDLDLFYRAINLYFNKFCTMAEESEDTRRSLIMTIAAPHNYMTTAVSITNNLWVTALGYDFNDKRAVDNFCTQQKIATCISGLKSKFDFVFVDYSFRTLVKYPAVMMHFDSLALCVENNLHSVVTTLRTLIEELEPNDIHYLNLKSKLIATKYNGESMYDDEILTPDRLSKLITGGMCDDFTDELQVLGSVPYTANFDKQIEIDVPICEKNALLQKSYDEILSRL
jgi:septum formation inhibitor-activating ATPase MinD